MRNFIASIIITIFIASCSDSHVYTSYKPILDGVWHKDSVVNFQFDPIDTISKNNVFIYVRNNSDYAYSNLFLIVGIDFPNNYKVVDTLEYEMADAEGRFLGVGLTDLKENKLEFKTNVEFPVTGTYQISIQQAMRKSGEIGGVEFLKGVTDVGLLIEKMNIND